MPAFADPYMISSVDSAYFIELLKFENLYPLFLDSGFRFFCFVLFLPVCMIIAVFLHEISHFLCYRLAGAEIKELKISVFHWRFDETAARLRLTKDGVFRGFCLCIVNGAIPEKKLRLALYMGSMGNVLLAAALLVMMSVFRFPESFFYHYMRTQLIICNMDIVNNLLNPYSGDRKNLRLVREYYSSK